MTVRRDFLSFTAGALAARTVLPVAARAEPRAWPVSLFPPGHHPQFDPHPDLELLLACERHSELLAVWNREIGGTDDEALWNGEGPAGIAYDANRAVINAAEPKTMAGVLAKAKAARAEATMEDGSEEKQAFTSDASAWAWDVMNDLLRLAGGGA